MPNTNCKARKGQAYFKGCTYFRGVLLPPTTIIALNTIHSKIHIPQGREEYIFLHPRNDYISSNLKFCDM